MNVEPVPAIRPAGPLPRPPGPVRRFAAVHPRIVDGIVVLVCFVGEVSVFGLPASVQRPPGWSMPIVLIAAVIAAVALWFRRRFPVPSFAVVLVCSVPLLAAPIGALAMTLAASLYALSVYRSNRAGWIGLAVAVGASELIAVGTSLVESWPILAESITWLTLFGRRQQVLFATFAILLAAVVIGMNVGGRKRYIAALVDHAEQLARDQEQRSELAVAAERSRIAREIHDIVAHSLSVMVRLSDGADSVLESDPRQARRVLGEIGRTGRQSLTEMRRVLGVLSVGSDHGAALDPSPELGDLATLIGVFRQTGLPVRYVSTGQPTVSAGVQLAVYRAVQETLTNALRYAVAPTEVNVEIDYTSGVTVTVTNDSAAPAMEIIGSGRGLIGLRERAALYGGTVRSEPIPGGGWLVVMTLPDAAQDR